MLATGGCALAHYFFHVPLAHLGVVAAVPLCTFFFQTRLAVVFVPRPEGPVPDRPPLANLVFILLCGTSLLSALVMAPSAFVYRFLGLTELYRPTLHFAGWALIAAASALVMTTLLTLSREFQKSIWMALSGEQRLFWQLARVPTILALCMTRLISEHPFQLHR